MSVIGYGFPSLPGNIKYVVKTNTYDTTLVADWEDIPGLSLTITPLSIFNRIKLEAVVPASNDITGQGFMLRFVRNGVAIGVADAASNRIVATNGFRSENSGGLYSFPMLYVDAPATTVAITYKIQIYTPANNTRINRSSADADTNATGRSISTFMATEF